MIGEDGNQIGVMRTDEALRYAQERDLDLVEVAPEARPPVCPRARLLEVQVRAGPEAEGRAQAPAADHDPRDQVPPEDRGRRLRHEEGPRRALPQAQGQGQGHDHVPRARGHAPRARADDPRPPGRGAGRPGHRRAAPQPRRAQHDDDARPVEGRAGRAVRQGRRTARGRRGPGRGHAVRRGRRALRRAGPRGRAAGGGHHGRPSPSRTRPPPRRPSRLRTPSPPPRASPPRTRPPPRRASPLRTRPPATTASLQRPSRPQR